MKIAYLCPDVGPRRGVAAARVAELSLALTRLGHEVVVLTPRGGAEALGFLTPVRELRVDRFDPGSYERLSDDPALGPAAARETASLYAGILRQRASGPVTDFRPDVVLEQSSPAAGAGLGIARQLRVPFVLEVVRPPRVDLELRTARSADLVVTSSAAIGQALATADIEEGRLAVLPDAVELGRFELAEAERERMRARLGLAGKDVVVTVGPLETVSALEPLLLALRLLDTERIDPHLVVAGDGAARKELERAAATIGCEPVTFAGAIPSDEIAELLAAADVAVLTRATAQNASCPPELLEFMAAGLPILAPDSSALLGWVEAGTTAWVFPPGDVDAITCALGLVLRNPLWRAELARAGRAYVREHRSWDGNAVHFVEALRGLRNVALAS